MPRTDGIPRGDSMRADRRRAPFIMPVPRWLHDRCRRRPQRRRQDHVDRTPLRSRSYRRGTTAAQAAAGADQREYPREAAGFWAQRNSARWEQALRIEQASGIAVCDSDPFKLHYPWTLWRTGHAHRTAWTIALEASQPFFDTGRLGLADLILVAIPDRGHAHPPPRWGRQPTAAQLRSPRPARGGARRAVPRNRTARSRKGDLAPAARRPAGQASPPRA